MLRPIILLLALLLVAAVANADGRTRPDAPGTLYNVGTHHLHLYCAGHGSPTVLFESGLGGIGLEWMDVFRQVAARSRACFYDRAGYGWSDAGPLPRTAGRAAAELATLLDAAGIHDRVLLVAHSFGGYVAQIFARAHAGRLAGVILVDASHPAQLAAFPIRRGSYCDGLERGYPLRIDLRPQLPAGFPRAQRAVALQLMWSGDAARAQLSELCSFAVSAGQAAGDGAPFPSLPLVVVSRGMAEFPATPRGAQQERAWRALQARLGTLTDSALHVIGRASGHHVHLAQPGLVAGLALDSVMLARGAEGVDPTRRFAVGP